MTAGSGYDRFAHALRGDYEAIVAQWVDAYRSSLIRLPRDIRENDVVQLASPILESLADMVSPGKGAQAGESGVPTVLTPGAAHLREVEKSAAFIGGTLASTESSGFDVAALILALRDVLLQYTGGGTKDELNAFFEWLAVLAVDSFSSARTRAQLERIRDQLEEGTPVVMIHRELPAALPLGEPDVGVLHSIFSRLVLQVVRVGAAAVIIDTNGLKRAGSQDMMEALNRFLNHRKIQGRVEVIVVGLGPAPEGAWLDAAASASVQMTIERDFDRAVELGLAAAGYRIVATRQSSHSSE